LFIVMFPLILGNKFYVNGVWNALNNVIIT
jgi:hypothetical protein